MDTPHNAGFMVADKAALKAGVRFKKVLFTPCLRASVKSGKSEIILIKPLTYMNLSGTILPVLIKRYKTVPENILVVCDNLDLAPGNIRMKKKGGTAGHNGLASIAACTGNGNFMRMYIGIGRPDKKEDVIKYVLSPMAGQIKNLVEDAVSRAADAVLDLFEKTPEMIINEVNQKQG